MIGDTQLNKLKIDIEKINEKEIFKNGKIIDLIIESFSSIDLRFEDDDIWRFALDCLDEILKNKDIENIQRLIENAKKNIIRYDNEIKKIDNCIQIEEKERDDLQYMINFFITMIVYL